MIAYTVVYRGAECTPVCSATFVTAASHAADQRVVLASWEYPSWFGDANLVVSHAGHHVAIYTLGQPGAREWFGGAGSRGESGLRLRCRTDRRR